MSRPLRILHCPATVGGHPGMLAQAERELGLDSWSVALEASPYGFEIDETLRREGGRRLSFELRRWNLVRRAARDFDVVHLNFGQSILPATPTADAPKIATRLYAAVAGGWDLRLLRRARRGIVVTFQGDDARQRDAFEQSYGAASLSAAGKNYSSRSDAAKRARIATLDRYAHGIFYLNPDLGRVLPERARFAAYANVDPRRWRPEGAGPGSPPLVVHAPSDRDVKGTRVLLEALDRLRAEGVRFDFELVEGRGRAAVRAALGRADLFVDQLVIGWYGGAAVEAMALGVPTVAFVREADLERVPAGMRADLPIIRADSATLAGVLGGALSSPAELRARGLASRAYVERWHDPRAIAAEMRSAYEAAVEVARRTPRTE